MAFLSPAADYRMPKIRHFLASLSTCRLFRNVVLRERWCTGRDQKLLLRAWSSWRKLLLNWWYAHNICSTNILIRQWENMTWSITRRISMIAWYRLAKLPIWVDCWAYCPWATVNRNVLLSNIWTVCILQSC